MRPFIVFNFSLSLSFSGSSLKRLFELEQTKGALPSLREPTSFSLSGGRGGGIRVVLLLLRLTALRD